MNFKTIPSLVLSLVMAMNSLPAVATVSVDEQLESSPEQQRYLEKKLDEAIAKADEFEEKTFSDKLDAALDVLAGESNKQIEKMSEEKAEKKFKQSKRIILKGEDEELKSEVREIDESELSSKEKLLALNNKTEHASKLKDAIVKMVEKAGSVKKFLENARRNLKEKKEKKEGKFEHWDIVGQVLGLAAIIVIGVVLGPEALMSYLAFSAVVALVALGLVILLIVVIIYAIKGPGRRIIASTESGPQRSIAGRYAYIKALGN